MKKRSLIIIFLLAAALFPQILFAKPIEIEIFAQNAILINADTGAVLYEKNANAPVFPASSMKIATALYVVEEKKGFLDQKFKASKEALATIDPTEKKTRGYIDPAYLLETDGTRLWILKGEEFSVRSLLYGMLLVSANDAANMIAESIGGTIDHFMEEFNQYLVSIGCENTHFCNPHGLHHPNNTTTAKDMALIGSKVIHNPLLREIVNTKSFVVPKTNLQKHRQIQHNNPLIKEGTKYYYPFAIGMKTGTHHYAQNTLVAAAEKNGRILIAALFGCEQKSQRFIDARRLFDVAFAEEKVKRKLLDQKASFTVYIEGARRLLRGCMQKDLEIEFFPAEEPEVKAHLRWKKLTLPIQKGECVGQVEISDKNANIIHIAPIFAEETISKTFLYSIKDFFLGNKAR